jgi:FkbM family methyltransferase
MAGLFLASVALVLYRNSRNLKIRNEYGDLVDIYKLEAVEQRLAERYVQGSDIVLELGARYGSVSCVTNLKLTDKTKHVVVEPDGRVWEALEANRKHNKCEFRIVKGFISKKKLDLKNLNVWYNGYGATAFENEDTKIPSYSLDEIANNLRFNVLIADCEGYLETFFNENPEIIPGLRMVIFEADYVAKCNYDNVKEKLAAAGLRAVDHDMGGYGQQHVWARPV